jgi:hypothetical protein
VRYEVIVAVGPVERGTLTAQPTAFDAESFRRLALVRIQARDRQTVDDLAGRHTIVREAATPEGYETRSVPCRIVELNKDFMVVVFQDPEAVRRLGPIEPADESGYVLVQRMRVREEHPVWRAVITPVQVSTPWRDRFKNRLNLLAGTPVTLLADVGYLVTSPIWLPLLVLDRFADGDSREARSAVKELQFSEWHPPLSAPEDQ